MAVEHDRLAENVTVQYALSALFALVVAGSLLDYSPASDLIHIAVTVPAVFVFAVVAVNYRSRIEMPRYALAVYLSIWLIYFPHAVSPTLQAWALIRLPIFMGGTFVLLFIVPQVISPTRFLRTVFYIATGLATLALPTLVLGDYDILWVSVSTYQYPIQFQLLGVRINPLESVLSNPNSFGVITGLGTLAGLGVYVKERRPVDAVCLVIVVGGLLFSFGRSAILGVALGSALFVVDRRYGRPAVVVLLACSALTGMYLIAALIGVVSDPLGVQNIEFYMRLQYWSDALATLEGNELFGIGFQPLEPFIGTNNIHSGYFYVLLTQGITGLGAHLLLFGLAYRQRLWSLGSSENAALLAMLTMILEVMAFEAMTLFGFAILPVLTAVVVGYAIRSG